MRDEIKGLIVIFLIAAFSFAMGWLVHKVHMESKEQIKLPPHMENINIRAIGSRLPHEHCVGNWVLRQT